MKTKLNQFILGFAALATLGSCADKMNYNEYKIYDKEYISETYSRVSVS